MRRVLNGLYGAALLGACLAMIAIAVLVLVQVLGRIIDRGALLAGLEPIGITVPSLAEIGGFLFVAATSLALPATLRAAVHVRVTLAMRLGGPGLARGLTLVVLVLAVGLAGFATWHMGAQALDSYLFNSLSYGVIRVPLWIPQGVMALGFGIFWIALVDETVTALRGHDPAFRRAEESREIGEGQ
ncbi:MAG: TRAP transporter small permease subunit [Pseudorhodobacter sp.]|nr:TRAP transporter small permease subunit [Pseudorhodobacter sp.]